jgi:hypothetical protein
MGTVVHDGGVHHGPFGRKMFSWSMPVSEEFDARPVRAFRAGPGVHVDESRWPASVPAVAQLLREGLELPAGLTVLVGENGSGKSTVVETLAEAYGLNPQGGSVQGRLFRIRDSEPGIGAELTVVRGLRAPWSYFLRAGRWIAGGSSHPLPRHRGDPGRAPARARVMGHAPVSLGRPEPGHRVAAVHARPAFVLPAFVYRLN